MRESQVLGLRAARQGLARPVRGEAGYRELFRRLQPVAPVFFSIPGSVPRLVHRTSFDDAETADRLRRRRELVKGRFGTGQIGYVLAADLEVYATAFRQVPARLGALERQVLEVLAATGPLSPRHLREETGILNKHLMPALHRLQRAFLVYEDQEDERWDRPWGLFASEWPHLELERQPWEVAAAAVVERFLEGYAFAPEAQLRAWSGFPVGRLRRLLQQMQEAGSATACQMNELGSGWVRPADCEVAALAPPPPPGVQVLHRADPLVRPEAPRLRQQYRGREVLQYLCLDGALRGAVCGHWRIRAHDVDDVVVDLPEDEAGARRPEVLAAVARQYPSPGSRILKYCGRALGERTPAPGAGPTP